MLPEELHERVHALQLPLELAAPLLGLTVSGLVKQMSGQRPVSRQTELLIAYVENDRDALGDARATFLLGRVGKPRLPWTGMKVRAATKVMRARLGGMVG